MIKKYGFYLLAGLVIFAGQFLRTSDLVTGTPPAIEQATLNGNPAKPLSGKGPAIIYFWAEWCGICAMMQNAVSAVSAEHRPLTIALRSGSDGEVGRYLHDKHLDWPVVNDQQGLIAQRFGVKAVPALFFTNREGKIVFTSVGYTSEWGLRARLWLAGFF